MNFSLSQTVFFALMAFSGVVHSAPAPQAPTEPTLTQLQQAIKDSHSEFQPVSEKEIAKLMIATLPYRHAPDEAAYIPPVEEQAAPVNTGESLASQGAPVNTGESLASQGAPTGHGVPSPPEGFPSPLEGFYSPLEGYSYLPEGFPSLPPGPA
ncbi:unnamed protein product [Mucor hiemalis]